MYAKTLESLRLIQENRNFFVWKVENFGKKILKCWDCHKFSREKLSRKLLQFAQKIWN